MDLLWTGSFFAGAVMLPKSILDYNFLTYQNAFGSTSIVHAGSRMSVQFIFDANNNVYTVVYTIIANSPYEIAVNQKRASVILSDGKIAVFENSGDSPITAIYGIKL